ncbi:MAG: hypothetical protein Q4F06_05895 [Eubacteriales bacterium]|nr:hypothetical protein [Eubacteriales bacterium]
MKSMEEIYKMTISELRKYVNSLSNEELTELSEKYESDDDLDPVELLDAARLYDYLKFKQGDVSIEM